MQVDGYDIKLDPNITQTSPSGKTFRVTGVGFDHSKASKWYKGIERRYKYVEVLIEEKHRIRFDFDYYDNFIKKTKL
jgi:hypothetical protein